MKRLRIYLKEGKSSGQPDFIDPEKRENIEFVISTLCLVNYDKISLLSVTTIVKLSPLFDETAVDWAPTINMGHTYVPRILIEHPAKVVKREESLFKS